jgi:hypothetical protein
LRKELKQYIDIRERFRGIFERQGTKSGYKGPIPMILLTDIKDVHGNIVCDHLGFNLTKGFEQLQLSKGDVVEFNARAKVYIKGYFGYKEDVYVPIEKDYKLSYPTKVRKLCIEH